MYPVDGKDDWVKIHLRVVVYSYVVANRRFVLALGAVRRQSQDQHHASILKICFFFDIIFYSR